MSTQSSSARITANQENATHSTGPKTDEGKAKSSRNAVTHALTGRTVLLATDDQADYEAHLQGYLRQFKPLTQYENGLVQALADTGWRLQRIPHLIMALNTKGREEFADAFSNLSPGERSLRIELEISMKYEKQIRNLQLQENRLHRRHEKDVAELRRVIQEREILRRQDLAIASKFYLAARMEDKPFDAASHGFDFTTEDVECYLEGKRVTEIAHDLMLPVQKGI